MKGKAGDVLRIELKDGSFTYARVLRFPLFAFYNFNAKEEVEFEIAVSKPVLFKIWVMKSALSSVRWKLIGYLPLESFLQTPTFFFKQDPINKGFYIVDEQSNEAPASREECLSLERAAVWSAEHVEDRLLDFYNGVPNKWMDSLRPN